jgi:hypothetical protein
MLDVSRNKQNVSPAKSSQVQPSPAVLEKKIYFFRECDNVGWLPGIWSFSGAWMLGFGSLLTGHSLIHATSISRLHGFS